MRSGSCDEELNSWRRAFMKFLMSTAAAAISASGRSNFSEACLRNLSREASNKANLGSAWGTSIIQPTSARNAEQAARRSLRRATRLLPTSSCTINWTRENSAMSVLANVLSKSLICPKSPWIEFGGHGPGPGWSGPFVELVLCWERP